MCLLKVFAVHPSYHGIYTLYQDELLLIKYYKMLDLTLGYTAVIYIIYQDPIKSPIWYVKSLCQVGLCLSDK